ncbi:PEP-CTERM sorting domain-containing protein [Candidatus Thiodiazotropha sp. CDECU1]|uniref:PEP-CTERM sorting domain-containing protein n=1 Tax=Candidatus Thiodiazotropha sp. CDECU1 TaxID=3065865 RepID=UPI0029300CAE|nr:PEP-CTERM sorting domain-containing protein [Candidatus Thiodiazotropha sp. CDECU1]
MKLKWLAIAFLGSLSAQTHATVIFSDSNTHLINSSIFEDVRLENGSDLHITQGGAIITPATQTAIYSSSGGASTITLTGNASVIGGIDYQAWSNEEDAVIANDNTQILGQGERASGHGQGAVSGARRVEVADNARLIGADNATNGGNGIDNTSSGAQIASIQGGEVIGGEGGQSGGNGIDGWIEVVGLDISGGTIQGGNGINLGGHGVTTFGTISGTISGGTIIGGSGVTGGDAVTSQQGLNLDISGGGLLGGDGGMYGGNAITTRYSHDSGNTNSTISGGYFDAGAGLIDDGWLLHLTGFGHFDITGGLFGYNNSGNGFGIFNNAVVDVYGWDLELNNDLLTGYLLDGSWIETSVTLAYNEFAPQGTLNLINRENFNVPEPGTLLLLMIGVTGMGLIKRNRV